MRATRDLWVLLLILPLVYPFQLSSPHLSVKQHQVTSSSSLSSTFLPLQVFVSAVTYASLVFAFDRPRGELFVELDVDVEIKDSLIPGAGKVRRGEEGERSTQTVANWTAEQLAP
jgi:hypothetical protein